MIRKPRLHSRNKSRAHRWRLLIAAVAAVAMLTLPPVRAADVGSLSNKEIAAQLATMDAKRAQAAPEYTSTRHYVLDYHGFPSDKHAEMVVKMVSHPPQKELTILSENGSAFLLKRVLHKLVSSENEANDNSNRRDNKLTPDNYDFQLLGTEDVDGRLAYVLQVHPKRNNKFLYEGKVWIDAEDFALVRISAKPAKNPSFWTSAIQIEHRYAKLGDFWLPRSNRTTSRVRLGGQAVLTIDYQQYDIETRGALPTPGSQ